MFDAEQITQHHQTFSIQMLRHQVSVVDCATDLSDPEPLLLSLSAAALSTFVSMCLMAPLPAAESQPADCCSVRPDSHVSLVSQLSYRGGQFDGLIRTAYHAVVL